MYFSLCSMFTSFLSFCIFNAMSIPIQNVRHKIGIDAKVTQITLFWVLINFKFLQSILKLNSFTTTYS